MTKDYSYLKKYLRKYYSTVDPTEFAQKIQNHYHPGVLMQPYYNSFQTIKLRSWVDGEHCTWDEDRIYEYYIDYVEAVDKLNALENYLIESGLTKNKQNKMMQKTKRPTNQNILKFIKTHQKKDKEKFENDKEEDEKKKQEKKPKKKIYEEARSMKDIRQYMKNKNKKSDEEISEFSTEELDALFSEEKNSQEKEQNRSSGEKSENNPN